VGLRSIAVPLRDGTNQVVASMNVSAHISRGSAAAIKTELLPLQEAAKLISEDLATR
jgi:IclR family transcriptional regulator, pca regulon regulatory protein